ncbi:MAG: sigma-54 dependent transcriptional regulator [Desulfobulbaceae bacterium]
MSDTILLVDDDASLLRVTEYNLTAAGFTVLCAKSGAEGMEAFQRQRPDLVITDVQLGDMDGIDLLGRFKELEPEVPVIVITAYGSIKMAVRAMQLGAFTFLTKPFDREALRLSCVKALELGRLRNRTRALSREVDRLLGADDMETANPAMQELLATALRVAESDATVLITGESGTGKEVLARLIHRHSPRSSEPFVAVNCAAIPENLVESELFGHTRGSFTGAVKSRKGRFQSAHHGTLFLDEIGDLPPEIQVKLLRALQERKVEPLGSDRSEEVDVRIIAATNRDLEQETRSGGFREDLFYRLSVIPLHLPPLRDRREDIPGLVRHFLRRNNATGVTLSPDALEKLASYHWPGNIRELQNVVERSVILRSSDRIDADDIQLPDPTPAAARDPFHIPPDGISLEEVEKGLIRRALEMSGGNRSQAARLLKIPRHVLIYRLEKYEIE